MSVSPVKPLKPKATAVWLIEQTALTFPQIAQACGLNILEVEALADDSSIGGIKGESPLLSGELTREEIARCEQDPTAILQFQICELFELARKKRERQYTPRMRRQDRPDAIAWVLKHYPHFTDQQICRLLGTTTKTVQAIRNRTHAKTAVIKPRHPVTLGFCTQAQLEAAIELAASKAQVQEGLPTGL